MLQGLRRDGVRRAVNISSVRNLTNLTPLPKTQDLNLFAAPFQPFWLPSPHEERLPSPGHPQAIDTNQPQIERELGRNIRTHHRLIEEVTPKLPKRYRTKPWVSRLSKYLIAASRDKNNGNITISLWRAYCLAKREYPGILHCLPNKAWDLLWDSQSVLLALNPNSKEHQRQLVEDMQSIGKTTTLAQRLAHLESTFVSGDKEDALRCWEEEHNQDLGRMLDGFKPEHLELGVRMYALSRNAERARQIMQELFDTYPEWNARLIITVFRAHTNLQEEGYQEQAWNLYLQLKDRLGTQMRFQDYDACFVGFLECRRIDYAADVFKDIIRSCPDFALNQISKVLRRVRSMYLLSNCIEEVNKVSLTALSVLPQQYHNRIYRDWVRWVVTKDSPATATQVLELMFERGVKPKSLHFNLLLGALFRSRIPENMEKAEMLAWKMVDARLDPTAQREYFTSIGRKQSKFPWKYWISRTGPPTPFFLDRPIPIATATTFAHLIRRLSIKWQWEDIQYLQKTMSALEIRPNTLLMNSLMMVDLRRSKYESVWTRFQVIMNPPPGMKAVFPNGATWRCLWRTLRLALTDWQNWEFESLPRPRQLMADMIQWLQRIKWHPYVNSYLNSLAGPRGDILGLVMRSFRYSKDLPGALVALHVMRSGFRVFPTTETTQILLKQMAWIELGHENRAVRSRDRHHTGKYTKNLLRLADVYQILLRQRIKRMKDDGVEYSTMAKNDRREMDVNLLSELIRVVMVRQYRPEEVEAMINEAKRDMGVPNITTGDIDSFNVV